MDNDKRAVTEWYVGSRLVAWLRVDPSSNGTGWVLRTVGEDLHGIGGCTLGGNVADAIAWADRRVKAWFPGAKAAAASYSAGPVPGRVAGKGYTSNF